MENPQLIPPTTIVYTTTTIQKDERCVDFNRTLDEVRHSVAPFLSVEILFKMNLEFWRLYSMYQIAVRGSEQLHIDRRQVGSELLELEREARLAEVERDAETVVPNVEQLASNLRWLIENGLSKNIGRLCRLKSKISRISTELDELRQDAERAIIWRASEDPKRWLTALRLAGPEEQVWLVTALISRVILQKEKDSRATAWGNAGFAAVPVITPEQQEALLDLLFSDNAELRAEAAFALGEGGGVEAIPALCNLAEHDSVPSVRTQAFRALGLIGGPNAVDALVKTCSR